MGISKSSVTMTAVCPPGLLMLSHMLVRRTSPDIQQVRDGAALWCCTWFKLGVFGSLLCQMMLEMMALRTTGEYVSEMLTMALVPRRC